MTREATPIPEPGELLIVAPLSNFRTRDAIKSFPLAPGIEIGRTPDFIDNKTVSDMLSVWDRGRVKHATHALLCYPTLFQPTSNLSHALDRVHKGQEHLNLALLAIWLARPGPAYFPVLIACNPGDLGSGLNMLTQRRAVAYDLQNSAELAMTDLSMAAELFPVMSGLFSTAPVSSLFMAITLLWSAIHESNVAIRHALVWIALEALFGTKDAGETQYRLSHRIALFVPADDESRQSICKKVKKSYNLRSKVIHGSSHLGLSDDADEVPLWTEQLLRRCLVDIIRSADLVTIFTGKRRDEYLECLVLQTEAATGR